ncbi:hypothetical protein HK405_010540 [Cladochytrium tenue]|nr:hypothetical protein HK405_010540 [Cladochytrium tenue]
MLNETEVSYGAILLHRKRVSPPEETTTTAVTPTPRDGDGHANNDHPPFEVLLLQHHKGHWFFCKGHAESEDDGDSRLTVVRELREEIGLDCGLSLDELGDCREVSNEYDRRRKGYTVHKTNFLRVVLVSDTVRHAPLNCQGEEILAVDWFEYRKAVLNITFKEDRELLIRVVAELEA